MEKLNNDFQVDPLSILKTEEYLNMDKSTFNKYKKSWIDFVKEQGISKTKDPTEQDFDEFFKRKKSNGNNFATLKSIYR